MAKKEETEQEPLTEEQRIALLEDKVGTNKLVLLIVALILIIAISVSITVFTINVMKDEGVKFDISMIDELKAETASLKKQVDAQDIRITQLRTRLSIAEEQLESSSNKRLFDLVIEQEEAHIEFVDALRSGMYDLAHMLPGSRTWLEVYGEKVDLAEAHARSRVKTLKDLRAGRAKAESEDDDNPFADGF